MKKNSCLQQWLYGMLARTKIKTITSNKLTAKQTRKRLEAPHYP